MMPFASLGNHEADEEDNHHIVDGDCDSDDDGGGLPFALGDSNGMSESFMKANEALGMSLAATTISTRSAASDLSSTSTGGGANYNNCDHYQTCTSPQADRTGNEQSSASDVFYTPRSVQTCANSPYGSPRGQPIDPPPQSVSRHPDTQYSPSGYIEDDADQPSAAAAAAAKAAAALIPVRKAASGSSFILQNPSEEQKTKYQSFQRRVGSNQGSQEDTMEAVLMAPLFPQDDTPTTATDVSTSDSDLSTSLGFSDLMRKAAGGGGTDDSFAMINAPLHPVIEEAASRDSTGKDSDDARTSTSTPPMSNLGGATIVPPGVDIGSNGPLSSKQLPARTLASFTRQRRSQYRTMGPSVQTTQLSKDSFSVSTHLPPPCSVREVIDVLANPDLLRLWCTPVKNAIVTREGGGLAGITGSNSNDAERQYDGEWVEITTPELVSPSSSCTSCLYKGVSAAMAVMGFPSHGQVKMFVERNRGQVGLSVGPFIGGMVADHTITVADNCALAISDHENAATTTSSGVVITDTVRIRRDEEVESGGGYSCGLFDLLEQYVLPGVSGYMTQAALSLENLCDVVCDGEACALAGTCSIDFGADGGLGDDGDDGRTPLLAQS